MGEFMENVSADMDTYTIRQPLGVTAGICPFVRIITCCSTSNNKCLFLYFDAHIELPGHDPAVDVPHGDCVRQHVRDEAVRARPDRHDPLGAAGGAGRGA